jgi:hypothetical protein
MYIFWTGWHVPERVQKVIAHQMKNIQKYEDLLVTQSRDCFVQRRELCCNRSYRLNVEALFLPCSRPFGCLSQGTDVILYQSN